MAFIIYRNTPTANVAGSVKNAPLANSEIDGNFKSLETFLAAAETNISTAQTDINTLETTVGGHTTDIAARVVKTSGTGSAVVPAGTTAQRDGTPLQGYIRFNSTLNQYEGYNGTAWAAIGGGATGAPGNSVFIENDQTVTGDYTLTAGKNAVSAGPVAFNAGVTVTVPTGATWTIVGS